VSKFVASAAKGFPNFSLCLNSSTKLEPNMKLHLFPLIFCCLLMNTSLCRAIIQSRNFFQYADIGKVLNPGSVAYDSARAEYLVAGGGANMWFTNDAFHFVWKEMSGDFTLTRRALAGHKRKSPPQGCLVIRQSLDPGSALRDVAFTPPD